MMIGALLEKLRSRTSFGGNVAVLLSGTVGGQALTLLAAPILTRLYSPADFGVLNVYTAVVMILIPLATMRYELGIPLARTDGEAANLIAICATVTIGVSVALLLLGWGLTEAQFAAMGLEIVAEYWAIIPLGLAGIGFYQVLVYEATRRSRFGDIARTKLHQGVGGPLSQIGMALGGFGPVGLILGFVIGQSLGIVALFRRLMGSAALAAIHPREMTRLARLHIRFPLYSSWSSSLGMAGAHRMMVLIMTATYGPEVGGFIFLAERFIGRPLLMVTTSVLQVYVGEISRLLTEDPPAVRSRFLDVMAKQALISGAWTLAAALAAPWVVAPVFGTEWGQSIGILQIMAVAYFPYSVMNAVYHTLPVLGRQTTAAGWEVARAALVAIVLIACHRLGLSAEGTLIAYVAVQAACYLALFLLILFAVTQAGRAPRAATEPASGS